MPIITKAGSPVKGSPTQFTLDKSALAAVTSVAADAYFSDSTNWKEVQLKYKSSVGNQSGAVKFDATLASPTANFAVSLKARDVFEIHNIVIKDFDGGSFQVPRSALTTADFDVDMTPIPSYRYYKISAKNGIDWIGEGSQYPVGVFSTSEFRLKWDGASQQMSSYTITQIIPANFDFEPISVIKDGDLDPYVAWREATNYPAGLATNYADIFSVDLGMPRQVTGILFAPQKGSNIVNSVQVEYPSNVPNEFKVYGSNDNSSWTQVYSHDNPSSYSSWVLGQFKEFNF